MGSNNFVYDVNSDSLLEFHIMTTLDYHNESKEKRVDFID